MIALAMEMSSATGSVALLRDGQVIGERSWHEKHARAQHVFHAVPELLKESGLAVESIEAYLVGRGPGSYSGLRVAIIASRALALPGGRMVYTVSSGEALAFELARDRKEGPIAIVGDARRGTLWLGLFQVKNGQPACTMPWSVVAIDDLASKLPAGCLVVSPDWTRLGPVLLGLVLQGGGRVEPRDCFPQARYVGELALARWKAGVPSEPLVPIYVHPAVGTAAPAGA